MDEQEQRILIRFLVLRLKKILERTHRSSWIAEMLPEQGYQGLDVLSETFRSDPSLQEEMDRHFAWLDKLMPPAETEIRDKVLREYLEKWNPEGEPN